MKRVLMMLICASLFTVGCGTQVANNPEASQPANQAALPFDGQGTLGHSPSRSTLPSHMILPSGTAVSITLQSAVSSVSARSGETFAAILAEPLAANGRTIAAGTPVTGRVVAAHSSGRLTDPGYLRLALVSISVEGRDVPVHSSSIFAKGESHKKRNLGWIGGGTAGGALIGGIAGGGKGALIGSAIGAGAGTTTAYATGKKDVAFGAEQRLTFRLTQPLTL